MVSAPDRREQVRRAIQRGIPRRRACALFQIARSALHYQSRLHQRDADLKLRLHTLAKRYPRYGYRRAWALVRAEQGRINIKRVHRIWCAATLQVPQRRPRRRVRGSGMRPLAPAHANHIWAYDFIHDRCANGQKLKLLTVVDEWTRECLAIEVDGRITAGRVRHVLQRLIEHYGAPHFIRSDNGPEFSATAIKGWLQQRGIQTAHIDAGKPWQNGTNESFNGKLRDECLNLEWFRHRTEARIVIEQWRGQYNEQRPHSSLGYRTPAQVRQQEVEPQLLSP
jgi:putative transposase